MLLRGLERKCSSSWVRSLGGSASSLLYQKPLYRSFTRRAAPLQPTSIIQAGVRHFTTDYDKNFSNSSFTGANAIYIEEMYRQWQADSASVHKSWDVYFRTGQYVAPPGLGGDYSPRATSGAIAPPVTPIGYNADSLMARVTKYVRAHQVIGHRHAKLDPLGLKNAALSDDLRKENYGITDADLDVELDLTTNVSPIRGLLDASRGKMTVREVFARVNEIYLSSTGFEYMHIPDREQCNWVRDHIETREKPNKSVAEKREILNKLVWADHFERYLAKQHSTSKRFGLEGAESFIPGMEAMINVAAGAGVTDVVIGMPHRGRLNVLANIMGKPLEAVLADFQHSEHHAHPKRFGTGDVKYHLGFSLNRTAGPKNSNIHLSLLPNPSHLEAVNPVVVGKVRAKQFYENDLEGDKTMAVLLHGDAAFSGQGVVWETLGFSKHPAYNTGGTVHVIVNNQIGFTTEPVKSVYTSDLARAINAPIFHVNGDDPEAVVSTFQLATEYRMKFRTDVVLDVVCYRLHGHNEIDEPMFTQPLMYNTISKHKSVLDGYKAKLFAEGVLTEAEFQEQSDKIMQILADKEKASKSYAPKNENWLEDNWAAFKDPATESLPRPTGVSIDRLRDIGSKLSVPEGFTPHRRLQGVLQKRVQSVAEGNGIDWGTAEALAFGSLLTDPASGLNKGPHHVRLCGQDVERGTFSHRHSVIHDQNTGARYTPLANLSAKQAKYTVANSTLSEYGAMGFEFGYSMENPQSLVLWEAQFGDFVNGAQIMIDQFISSTEDKWLRQSGLVLLLPHGYEGQGPEHSSARPERFLQQSSESPDRFPSDDERRFQIQQCNWQVVNLTTAANYFHVLRRQILRDFRKPLVVFSPKQLLRFPGANSNIEDMAEGTKMQWVIPEHDAEVNREANKVKKVVFSSGKVYYDMLARRQEKNNTDTALVRVEQLSPFPFHQVREESRKYPNAEVVWCQEEPQNQGYYSYIAPRFITALKDDRGLQGALPKYVGRVASAATATGYAGVHEAEKQEFLSKLF